MLAYIVRRLVHAVIVFVLVTIMIFMVMRLLPGDPILMLISQQQVEQSSEEQIAELRHKFGLDKPMIVQYFDWIGGVFQGELGVSIVNGQSVSGESPAEL